mgnify:CR=1 FL=1
MITLAHIVRHPIKSVGYEELDGAPLTVGRALPFDREWAVSHVAAKFDRLTGWQAKMNFLRGVAGPELMAIRAESDESARRVTLFHPQAGSLTVAPDSEGQALVDWLSPLWPEGRPAPRAVEHVPGQAMTDWPDPFIAVLGLASNRELGARLGQDLSIHRWRGNLWLDGLAPWQEFDLIGRQLASGGAVLEIRQRITRCKATTVNPATGVADADTLGALAQHYGHEDFGTYAVVVQSGAIRRGDEVRVL